MRILVTGASGQVGLALAKELSPLGNLCLADRQNLDLSKPHAIPERLEEIKPDLIINAAAYTAVDKAETEPDIAYAVNGTAVGVLGEWAARKSGAPDPFLDRLCFRRPGIRAIRRSPSYQPAVHLRKKQSGGREASSPNRSALSHCKDSVGLFSDRKKLSEDNGQARSRKG